MAWEKGAQKAEWNVVQRIGIDHSMNATLDAPEIPNSDIPALSGGRSLQYRRALIDSEEDYLYLPGPGGDEIRLSPGS